jgi:MerR family regulatory protein
MSRDQQTGMLRPGEAARLLGVDVSTLRALDRQGRLKPDQRTNGGHRRYSPETVGDLLDELRRMAAGYPLPAVSLEFVAGLGPEESPLFSLAAIGPDRHAFYQAICEEMGCDWKRDLPRSLGTTPRAQRLAERLFAGHWLDEHFQEVSRGA